MNFRYGLGVRSGLGRVLGSVGSCLEHDICGFGSGLVWVKFLDDDDDMVLDTWEKSEIGQELKFHVGTNDNKNHRFTKWSHGWTTLEEINTNDEKAKKLWWEEPNNEKLKGNGLTIRNEKDVSEKRGELSTKDWSYIPFNQIIW